jgi:xylulose-5-phosphate/fructose-6-phosphate phosphoketolase
MHQTMAATMEVAVGEIRALQEQARTTKTPFRPRWPMIVLRSPKGWTGPKEIKGHKAEGSWRSHQVPFSDVQDNPPHLQLLEDWMRSYRHELSTRPARCPRLRWRRGQPPHASANPHANGGLLRKALAAGLPRLRSEGAARRQGL